MAKETIVLLEKKYIYNEYKNKSLKREVCVGIRKVVIWIYDVGRTALRRLRLTGQLGCEVEGVVWVSHSPRDSRRRENEPRATHRVVVSNPPARSLTDTLVRHYRKYSSQTIYP